MHRKTKHELRCFCSRRPLLAVYGKEDGELYIHVKVFKQGRIFGEVLVKGGSVKIRCRDCFRWHQVNIRPEEAPTLEETTVSIVADDSP